MRLQSSRHALGSDAIITLVGDGQAALMQAFDVTWQLVDEFERRFSRFLPDSELTHVNDHAGEQTPVSHEFAALVEAARHYGELTGGLYNPFMLPALQRAGYKGSWPRPHDLQGAPDYAGLRAATDASSIQVNDSTVSIPAGTALDFGGIGKGYLLDLVAARLEELDENDYWVSLGGDIVSAGFDEGGTPWRIAIDQAEQSLPVGDVVNDDGGRLAVATSGVIKRRGPGWHHIIDPRTLRPARSDVLAATVCGASATMADVAAKCLVIAGSQSAPQLARQFGLSRTVLQIKSDSKPARVQEWTAA